MLYGIFAAPPEEGAGGATGEAGGRRPGVAGLPLETGSFPTMPPVELDDLMGLIAGCLDGSFGAPDGVGAEGGIILDIKTPVLLPILLLLILLLELEFE